ncbi:hypothetical protein N7466_003346 [Penicillium verhagenii]|uniref:uncharacterized protein n=1 Tax=Penicillium verhagenii TaxID=1562060 RepID=UPI002545BB54|nr:uncharacterized protein N7466_003346 [Penicillium verhagenii]KAJ5936896.1 hypothetical protein N7466_003346 [Penicillium verhagenii]
MVVSVSDCVINYVQRACRQFQTTHIRRVLAGVGLCALFAIVLLFPGAKEHIIPVSTVQESGELVRPASTPELSFYVVNNSTVDGGDPVVNIIETSQDSEEIPYNPYPDYNSVVWRAEWKGEYQQCTGPAGILLDTSNRDLMMKAYKWNTSSFPSPVFGSYESWNLDNSLCTDRYSQYSAYGYGNESGGIWANVNLGELQHDCLQRNAERYEQRDATKKGLTLDKIYDNNVTKNASTSNAEEQSTGPDYHTRTAIILRSWINKVYTENDLHFIRSMVMELSLFSGAEYEVILLVDSTGTDLPDPTDKAGLDEFKNKHLPQDLHEIAVFFDEDMLAEWYPKIDVHVAILQYFQPIQIFSRLNPQYDYIWQFELDSRYTGHLYHFLEQAATFAKQQPRKNLWERNSHFYIPAVHGPWSEFTKTINRRMADTQEIWGPHPAIGIHVEKDAPKVPASDDPASQSNWGVGEEADVITWMPQFDPRKTGWPFRDRIFNFWQMGETPVRASPVAMSRVSARLLALMHADKTRRGFGLASEMSPVSWALYYGLKSVQVPLPIYHELSWDPVELDRRANSGKPGRVNAGPDSVWSWGMHDDILLKLSYMFSSKFPEKLYRAWLGLDGAGDWEKSHRRLCLPPMLLHPVKKTA